MTTSSRLVWVGARPHVKNADIIYCRDLECQIALGRSRLWFQRVGMGQIEEFELIQKSTQKPEELPSTNDSIITPLGIAVLTVSDTRSLATDTSGQALADKLQVAGHRLAARALVVDDVYRLRAQVSQWIAEPEVAVVLITGGTGFSGRDSTPEALEPLFDKSIPGFGELFRHLSYREIGTSTLQSRAVAGLANRTAIFCLPGSTHACETAWDKILKFQLDSRHRPCNFVEHLVR